MPRTFILTAALSGALALVTTRARAGDPAEDARNAEAMFQSGRAAMDRGDLGTACPLFAASQRLDPAVGTLLNLGECEHDAGRLASALESFRAARAELPVGDPRLPFADERIAELVRRTPMLTLVTPRVAEAKVVCDGHELSAAQLGAARPVEIGTHVCVVAAPGRADARTEITLREGDQRSVELMVGAVPTPPAPPAAPAPPSRESTQRWIAVGVGGVGLVALGVGAAFGLRAKGTYDDGLTSCPGGLSACDGRGVQRVDDAHTQATVSTIAFVGGAALLAAGLILYFTSPKHSW